MAPIERDHDAGADGLGEGDDGGVGSAEGEVGVAPDQFCDPMEVFARVTFDIQASEAV